MPMEFDSLSEHFELFADMAPPVQRAAATLSEGSLTEMKRALAEALRPYMVNGRIRLSASALGASGAVD
jgi:hypothetical protein